MVRCPTLRFTRKREQEISKVKSHDGKKDTGLVNVGGKSMAANPKFEQDAFAFEDKLGAKAWAHPVAQAAAADMAKKAKAYIQDRVGGKWDAASGELASLCKEIGSDNPGWSGAAGKAVKDVMAVFDAGSLAERMNHIGEFVFEALKDVAGHDRVRVLRNLRRIDDSTNDAVLQFAATLSEPDRSLTLKELSADPV